MQNQNLPIFSYLIDSIGPAKAKYQTKLDAKSSFQQIPLAQDSRKYSAFSTNDGAIYEFCILPLANMSLSHRYRSAMSRYAGTMPASRSVAGAVLLCGFLTARYPDSRRRAGSSPASDCI